ncbi:uncharacterized protein N7496_004266 [Penicillium cataractarum]|uniref:beta-glucosidase n=1 Tax=Penicillium cataractarum TaxID=2100454 RepID=A0A9W9SSU9_9EURO|nr:uncharacterized protein N7496_004266 [Penicillium cataractarum]KAJ5381838.1 hypothetical protein N7496_004266 [Penicillium cataractarum]
MSVEQLVQSLSLEEKVSLLAGKSYWRTAGLAKYNIKPIKQEAKSTCTVQYSDGPNGVRGESIHASTKATCFPCAALVGSTFNPDLAHKMGQVIGKECNAKGVGLLLGPTINLHRSPLGGRNFEAYSEDPTLSGLLGAAFVKGVQSEGVSACPKHFVGNECETNRKTSNTIVDEKTLRELYSYAFQVLFKESTPWAIMTSYNLVNGAFMSENEELLQGLLRKEWGFQGAIVSDFEGVYSTVPSVMAGVALELPGPARFRGEHLLKAIQKCQIAESHIDDLVKDVIALSAKVGMKDETAVEKDILKEDSTATLVRDIAAEGIILLKNDGNLLPLLPSKKLRIAVFGSPAANPIIHGGGSASLTSSYVISPLDALKEKFGEENIHYHPGVPIFKKIPSAPISVMTAPSIGQPGVDCFWYNGWVVGENPVHHEILETTRTLVIESRISDLQPKHCSRMSFILRPKTTGLHRFGVTACGKSVLRVNGKVLLEHSGFDDCRVEYVMQPGDFEERADIFMEAGCEYEVTIDTLSTTAPSPSPIFDITPQATSVGFYENLNTPINEQLQQLASESDVAIIFTANNKEYESESFDRSSLSLSPLQDELIRAVSGAAPKSILVNQTGSPISMSWIDEVDSILQCWYAGQEVGNALADIISGDINPSGKLPVTFPKCIEDTPSFGNFPTDENMRIRYEEGLEMGYRASKPAPLFPFGYGKSYTEFEVQGLAIKRTASLTAVDLTVATTVTNVGPVAGGEVVQVYVDGVLKAFRKVLLSPGDSHAVEVTLDKYAFSEWSSDDKRWIVKPRVYSIELRQDANTLLASTTYNVETGLSWSGL